MIAFDRAWQSGFGLETDVRDCNGKLVISHDMPGEDALSVEAFLQAYVERGGNTCLGLNIKADGLASPLKSLLEQYGISNYFVFDMSVPDTLHYVRQDMTVFTRRSEYEPVSVLEADAQGIWWDSFTGADDVSMASMALEAGKRAALVSPELHGRPYKDVWKTWFEDISVRRPQATDFMVCTDFPDEFQQLLNECEMR